MSTRFAQHIARLRTRPGGRRLLGIAFAIGLLLTVLTAMMAIASTRQPDPNAKGGLIRFPFQPCNCPDDNPPTNQPPAVPSV